MLNENLMADKQQNPSQLKLPSSLQLRKIPTIPFTQVKTSINILKVQPRQKQKQQKVQNQKQQHYGANRMKIKECRTQYVYYIIIHLILKILLVLSFQITEVHSFKSKRNGKPNCYSNCSS